MTFSNMHIVMLSNTATREMYMMTRDAIDSVNKDRPKGSVLTLVETQPELNQPFYKKPYEVTRLIHRSPFNYNLALAAAVQDYAMLPSDIFCVLNNDIIVHPGAFAAMQDALTRWDVVSAWADNSVLQRDKHGEHEGYRPSHEFSGWAWMCRWSMVQEIGFESCFPGDLKFWYQDNWFIDQFMKYRKRHALIRAACVTHLESRSHTLLENVQESTVGQKAVFDRLRRENAT